ncbi:MAG TPA: DUF6268 family outer membrane beta-barrel protein [Verrucomicrobiae bacterium]|nr:DUF6268 family outer membrane beta-barrel protein [Verrucomicrobiae bacterium]
MITAIGAVCALAALGPLADRGWAGDMTVEEAGRALDQGPVEALNISHELEMGGSHVFGGDTEFSGDSADVSEWAADLQYVAIFQLGSAAYLRAGLGYESYWFMGGEGLPVPASLQELNLVVGADVSLSDHWLMRVEAMPGIYSDFADIGWEDFNVPFNIGFTYLVNDRLQWAFGFQVNFMSDWPVVGGAGMRWQVSDYWTLNLMVPRPRIEYKASENLTLFTGCEFRGGSFRVAEDFGEGLDREELNGALVDYREYRAGAGLSWLAHQGGGLELSVEIQGGVAFDREFDFHRTSTDLDSDPAPYASLGAKAKF